MSLKYFKYLIKSTKRTSIFLFIINFALVPFLTLVDKNKGHTVPTSSKLYMVTILLFIESAIINIFLHMDYLKKSGCDMIFSLPDKREKIMNTKLLFGYTQVMVCMLIPFIVNAGLCILYFKSEAVFFFLYLVYMLIVIAAWYLLIFLINSLAKNMLDAFVLNILVIIGMLLIAIVFSVYHLVNTSLIFIGNELTTNAQYFIYRNVFDYTSKYNKFLLDDEAFIALGIHVAIAIASYFLGMYSIKRYKPETVEGPNENICAYTLINPLVMGIGFALFIDSMKSFDFVVLTVFLTLAYLTIMFVGQRKIKFTKQSLISVGILIVSTTIYYIIAFIF